MPPHSIGSGTISFGLVSIPIRMYTAASSAAVSFNLLHAKCGSRIRQQTYCPVCKEVVDRTALVKGYEVQKDEYVRFSDEELKGLEGEASRVIDIAEFVPLAKVDPIYFEKTYYLGPDKGGEKAYRLLTDAMAKTDRVALAKFVMRGKESLVLIRPSQGGLMFHTMYFADEVRTSARSRRARPRRSRRASSIWPCAWSTSCRKTSSPLSSTRTTTASGSSPRSRRRWRAGRSRPPAPRRSAPR